MEDIIELYDLIEYEKECLKVWSEGEDTSSMPDGWSVLQQDQYLEGLYRQYFDLTVKFLKKELIK